MVLPFAVLPESQSEKRPQQRSFMGSEEAEEQEGDDDDDGNHNDLQYDHPPVDGPEDSDAVCEEGAEETLQDIPDGQARTPDPRGDDDRTQAEETGAGGHHEGGANTA